MDTKKAQKARPFPEPPVDFVVVTALPEERDALLATLPGAQKLDKGIRDIHAFHAARIKTRRKDKSEYAVIVTCLVKMGPITATAQTVSVVARWQPRYVLLVGIACGVRGAVKHGDILIATQVADYTIGKQEGGLRKINWDVYPCGVSLLDSANDLGDAWRKGMSVNRPGGGGTRPGEGCGRVWRRRHPGRRDHRDVLQVMAEVDRDRDGIWWRRCCSPSKRRAARVPDDQERV